MKRVKKGGIEAACQAALGALVLAALGSLGYRGAWAAMPPQGAAASAPADPCQDRSQWVQYQVAAIDVKMVLNRFGDRDDDAFMYVGAKKSGRELDDKIQAVRTWEEQLGCTSWDPSGSQKQHKSCVSTGLRDDLVQPLVLRANLGQCVVINFTNRLDPNKKPLLPSFRTWPNDDKASLDVSGLAYSAEKDGAPVHPPDTFARTGEQITYKIRLPTDPGAERAYYFQDGGGNRQRVAHGLFGVIVAEPAGSEYLDPKTGGPLEDGIGWEAIIRVPDPERDFREFVIIYHEIGDEDYRRIIDGSKDSKVPLPQIVDVEFRPYLEKTYRPGGRALNYRSEPFLQRLAIKGNTNNAEESPFAQKKALAYSSYTFGDPATPIPRSYLGEPTKTRLVHGGSEVFHVHHLHGGGDRWRRNPKADPHNDIASGLNKVPNPNVFSTHLDSQTIGPGTSYNLEHECGAGGCQQAAGDFLYHCHIGHHYIGGMWGFWRVFDTKQKDLATLPDMAEPPRAVDSTQLLGKTFGDRKVVKHADPNDLSEVSLKDWVESQLPPKGVQLDCDDTPDLPIIGRPPECDDATVWNWETHEKNSLLYLGEPETTHDWVNYPLDSDSGDRPGVRPGERLRPGERPVIQFNEANGRYAWPLFRPHLGQRPPFSPNGHSGAPWLGEQGSKDRPDGLCPDRTEWGIPHQTLEYPISAVPMDVVRNEADLDGDGKPDDTDADGKLFVLNEDIRGETPEGKVLLDNSKTIEPLVIRSNVGDCVRVIFTSRLKPEDKTGSKVNMHTHFVQFDPQASDGVISGFSYEQSVRPYDAERRSEEDTQGAATEKKVRRLEKAVSPGAEEIVVNQRYRLREGIWIGVGLGEGVFDATNACCTPQANAVTPRTEIRRIAGIEDTTPNTPEGPFTLRLDRRLDRPHQPGEAVGVEFVQYHWYSDVDVGTVFWHDHVDFNSWGHGLASAHVIEPVSSTWHDPKTGKPVRSGAIVDIHTPPDASVGAGQRGSFREFVLLNIKQELNPADDSDADAFGLGKATINLRKEPIVDPRAPTIPRTTPATGRNGAPAYWFSSVTHGDPATPLPRAYVGDPFVIRHLGVLDREGGIRLTGHRFRIERFAEPGAFSDGSPIGISERYDLVLDGGAGGSLGKPGDFMYYNTLGRDMLGGAWGLIRVHDTLQEDKEDEIPLKPLPDRSPPKRAQRGNGFPSQKPAKGCDNSGPPPRPCPAPDNVDTCPEGTPLRPYEVKIRETPILRQARLGDLTQHPELTVEDGIAFTLAEQPKDYVLEPLVLRVNEGECLKVRLTNELPHQRAGWHVGELLFDPQSSHASAIGLNLDSTVPPGDPPHNRRTYYYFADRELGTTLALNLADPITAGKGAFGAVIVEPKGSEYRPYQDPVTGKSVKIGVFAEIVAPARKEGLSGSFREIVTLFHDSDPFIGHNDMEYPWEAHCLAIGLPGCQRDFRDPAFGPDPFKGFTSISYKLNRWSDRGAICVRGPSGQPVPPCAPSEVYRSEPHGDPGLVIAGTPGLPLMFRVAAPWGEQLHSFSLSGHRWPLEPGMHHFQQICRSKPKQMCRSEEVFAHLLAPGYAFDVPVIGGFGGGYGITGDFLFRDARMPFTEAGLWGLIRVEK